MVPRTQRLLVITPTLGRSPWLDRTIASVQRHCGPAHTHVLVAPLAAHARLRARYPRCRVLPDRPGAGVYGAINAGLANASGNWQWFTWINDDDELAPGFDPHRERACRHDGDDLNAPWRYGQVRLCNDRDADLGRLAIARQPGDIPALVASGVSPLNQQGLLIPRAWTERLGGLPEHWRICADLAYWLTACAQGARLLFSPEVVACFRLRPGQVSGDVERHQKEFRAIARAVLGPAPSRWRQWGARARFRASNWTVYAERCRRCGWKGGFDLLREPQPGGAGR